MNKGLTIFGVSMFGIVLILMLILGVYYMTSNNTDDGGGLFDKKYAVSCDITVKAPTFAITNDIIIDNVECQTSKSGILLSYLGFKEEGDIVMTVDGKTKTKTYGVWETTSKIYTLEIGGLTPGEKQIKIKLYHDNEGGVLVDEEVVFITVGEIK